MSNDLVRPEDIELLPVAERGVVITKALEESKSWLAVATQATDPTPIAEFKAWAATVAEMTRQKGLAEEIQLDALEMVRRADRGIGIAIRNGQEAGQVTRMGESGGPSRDYERGGATVKVSPRHPLHDEKRMSPSTFFKGGTEMTQVYSMSDGVSDEQFDEVIVEARAEGNLSRANVARKAQGISNERLSKPEKLRLITDLAARGNTSRQISPKLGISDDRVRWLARQNGIEIPADRVTARTRRVDPERIVEETVHALEGLRSGLGLVTPEDLDGFTQQQVREWLYSLSESLRSLRKLTKELNDRA